MASPVRSPGPSGGARVHLLLGLFALFVVASLLTRWLSLVVEILDMDEAAHAVGSWVLLDGGRLYTDFVDNKPPLLYGYYALAQLLLGRGLLSVHLFTAVVTVPLAALAASAAFRHDRRGVAAGLLWLVYGASFLAHDMLAANAELVLLLPASWAIALVADEGRAARSRPLFLAGLLLGLATLVKHQAAFWLPALAWAALRARPSAGEAGRAPRALALGAGFALPLLATWVAFAATGGARDLLYWLVWRNVLYAASPITAAGALERAASYLLPWLVATTPLWWAWRTAAHWDWLMDDLERTEATYMLDTAPAGLYRWNRYPLRDYPRLDRYVAEGYERLDDVSRVRVYRRRGCAAR